MTTFKNIGQSIWRKDGRGKLMGETKYPRDIYLDGMVFGHTVRSTKPHADITFDILKAEAMESVLKVLTYKDVNAHNHHADTLSSFCYIYRKASQSNLSA